MNDEPKYNPNTNEFEVTSKRNSEVYFVRLNPKTREWQCTCWWFSNRTAPNKDKYGEAIQ